MTRSLVRTRRNIARVAVFVPAATSLVVDVVLRRPAYPGMLREDAVALTVTWALSVTLWTCATIASTRRRGHTRWFARALLAILGAVAALQVAAFFFFATTIDFQLLRSAWQLEG